MKRFITFLSVLFFAVFAYAEDFDANDKVLYFSPEVLIDVIRRTFAENLHYDVAQKYIEVEDKNGNVSIADLVEVCAVGNLDNAQCRNFINDLIVSMGDDSFEPFYWADYVSSDNVVKLGFNSYGSTYSAVKQAWSDGDGYHRELSGGAENDGKWIIQFDWMKYSKDPFGKHYPGTKYLEGTSACTNEIGNAGVADKDKNFSPNQQSGDSCWCKMTWPEESSWVYYGDGTDGGYHTCERSCSLMCLSAIRGDDESMRRAMFTWVKLDKSNASTSQDTRIEKELINEFKPKPAKFDWVNNTKPSAADNIWIGWKTQKPHPLDQPVSKKLYGSLKRDHEWIYEQNSDGLNYEEWAIGGYAWMQSEEFQYAYPNVDKIKGVATCNDADFNTGNTNFTPNEKTGYHCWCKIISPVSSPRWAMIWTYYSGDLKSESTGESVYTEETKKLMRQSDIEHCDSECLIECAKTFSGADFSKLF